MFFTWLWLTSHGILSRYIEILLPIFRFNPSIDIIVPPDLAGIYICIGSNIIKYIILPTGIYSQRMRFQRRLYEMCSVLVMTFMVPFSF